LNIFVFLFDKIVGDGSKLNYKLINNKNMKKTISILLGLAVVFGITGVAIAEINSITPSTNDINRTNEWAHVDQVSMGEGTTDLQFISTRDFYSCFEYRTDGDTSQMTGTDNYNSLVTDGLYPYFCQKNDNSIHTITADEYVEVRMVFGAETDERFDWTRFDVLYPRSAEITAPVLNEDVYGSVDFSAYLNDDDVDAIQWAVRQGTCEAGVGTVFGNVDGHSDVATIDQTDLSNQTFLFVGDMSSLPLGTYCFVYNPMEDNGETDIRKTVEFNLVEAPINYPTDKEEYKKGGWRLFNNPEFRNQGQCISYIQANERAGKRD
jgi:hypothetical protein